MNSQKIADKLKKLYPSEQVDLFIPELEQIINEFNEQISPAEKYEIESKYTPSEKDVALITYANSIENESHKHTLQTFKTFFEASGLNTVINTVHFLPFFPWDTDRGFSVKDYYHIEKDYGDWNDVKEISKQAKIMIDFVLNHASIDNPAAQSSLIERHISHDDPRYKDHVQYKDFVIAYNDENKPSDEDLAKLIRPRPNPVLTRYVVLENKENKKLHAVLGIAEKVTSEDETVLGQGWIWTTFSRPLNQDGTEATRQVDLNIANISVLKEVIRILLFYISRGARLIRLDAIGYAWKKIGSQSLHEPEVHQLSEIMHDIMIEIAPGVLTISEVNEPQSRYFEYLGQKGKEESDMIYQFAFFTLAVNSLIHEDTKVFKDWLKSTQGYEGKQFVTVLGSHDGLSMKPIREMLSEGEIDALGASLVQKNKALPNYGVLPGGKRIVYEACSTPWNLINPPDSKENFSIQLDRYSLVLALGLVMRGLPALYINGVLGAENYQPPEGLDENRTINRQIFEEDWLLSQIKDSNSHIHKVLESIKNLLKIRIHEPAFSPNGKPLQVLPLDQPALLGIFSEAENKDDSIISIANMSDKEVEVSVNTSKYIVADNVTDLIHKETFKLSNGIFSMKLKPYQIVWLKK